MNSRMSESDDATIRAALDMHGRHDLSVKTFRNWEASLPEGQRLVVDLFGDFYVADATQGLGPFVPPA